METQRALNAFRANTRDFSGRGSPAEQEFEVCAPLPIMWEHSSFLEVENQTSWAA